MPWISATINATHDTGPEYNWTTGTTKTKKNISQEGIDKLIYDVLSSDRGLASLAAGENVSGGYGSSTKRMMSQDLITKLVGELANITAETTTTSQEAKKRKKEGGQPTVICTELMKQGLLDPNLYSAGEYHFLTLPEATIAGYQFWGIPVAFYLKTHPRIAEFIAPIAVSRYEMIVHKRFKFWGALTIYIAQPICYVLGIISGRKAIYA